MPDTAIATAVASVDHNRASEIIYQIYPASFKDSGETERDDKYKGFGDLQGITDKLQYVRDLGVDAIWISPFFLSPEGEAGDGGYAISDYRKIDPRFGTMPDFEKLLAAAHKPYEGHPNGLRIYTDFVLCHTSNEHEWFVKSRNKEADFENYYVWSDGGRNDKGEFIDNDGRPLIKKENGDWIRRDERGEHGEEILDRPRVPNNWQSVFNGKPAWSWDNERKQYYLHHFNSSQPSLNLNDETVQKASRDQMQFWLDKGVDGLRIDALPYANYDPEPDPKLGLRGNKGHGDSPPGDSWGSQFFDRSMCQKQTEEQLLPEIRKLANSYHPPKHLIVEAIAGPHGGGGDMEQATKYIDRNKGADSAYTNAIVSLFYDKNSMDAPDRYPPAQEVRDTIRKIIKLSPDGGFCNNLGNHDFPRYAGRITSNVPPSQQPAAIKQLLMMTSSLPGSLCLYNGDELGLTQATPDDLKGKKQDLLHGRANRDGCRTTMPWEAYAKNMGFSDHDNPYLPAPDSHQVRAVDVQELQPDSMLNVTRRVLQQRKLNPAIDHGATMVLDTYDPIVAFVRQTDDQAVLCTFNMSNELHYFIPSQVPQLKNHPELLERMGIAEGDKVYIPPYGSSFLGLRKELSENAEIGMEALPLNEPNTMGNGHLTVTNKDEKKIFAADILPTDIHISGSVAETVLGELIMGETNQKRSEANRIVKGEKSTITEEECQRLLRISDDSHITAGGSTVCTLSTLKKLLDDKVSINLMGFATDDRYGKVTTDFLHDAGIKVNGHWPKEVEAKTAISFIIDHEDGQHTILTYPGKQLEAFLMDQKKQLTSVPVERMIMKSDLVYLPESTLDKLGLPFLQNILKSRSDHKKELVLTLPTHANFGTTDSAFFKYLIPNCNVVMGNDVEFYRILSGDDKPRSQITDADIKDMTRKLQQDFEEGEKVLKRDGMPCPRDQVAFITRGEKDALVVTKRGTLSIPAAEIPRDDIQNKLGAGNAAFAGFLAGYIRGLDHEQSAEEAMRRGAEKIRQEGPEPYIHSPVKSWALSTADPGPQGYAAGIIPTFAGH